MQRDGKTFDGICPNQVRQKWTNAVTNKTVWNICLFTKHRASLCSGKDFYSVFYPQDKVFVPRSSSPVTVYVEFPCIIEQGKLNLTQWVNFRISAFKSLWAHKCIQGSHCFLLSQLSQQLHGMIWKRVCPLWDRRETPSAVRWEKKHRRPMFF